jgi:hypothetical protein
LKAKNDLQYLDENNLNITLKAVEEEKEEKDKKEEGGEASDDELG